MRSPLLAALLFHLLASPAVSSAKEAPTALGAGVATAVNAAPAASSKWEKEIAAFEQKDQTEMPPKNGILFVGSSSIRKWVTLRTDFPDLPVYNRGFGGSVIADSTLLAERIVFPYEPRLIVFYAGGNDIHGGSAPEKVAEDFKVFAKKVHAALPKTKIQYISISPNPARWAEVERVKVANGLIEQYCHDNASYLTFLNFFPHMLGADGQPMDLFVSDKLHMNEKGYQLWAKLLWPHLDSADGK